MMINEILEPSWQERKYHLRDFAGEKEGEGEGKCKRASKEEKKGTQRNLCSAIHNLRLLVLASCSMRRAGAVELVAGCSERALWSFTLHLLHSQLRSTQWHKQWGLGVGVCVWRPWFQLVATTMEPVITRREPSVYPVVFKSSRLRPA